MMASSKKKQGVCALCLQYTNLRRSHFLGRAIHRLNGRDQVIMTPQLIEPTQKQFWRHLLCGECERRFSENGERHALSFLQRKAEADFRLLNWLNLAEPIWADADLAAFSGSAIGVDTERLAYFALSVLWRSCMGPWPTLKQQTTGVSLGEFREPIRRYLLGETAFPAVVTVHLWVCTDHGSRFMTMGPTLSRGTELPTYSFLARGLWFHIVTSSALPTRASEGCCVNSPKRLIFRRNAERELQKAGGFMMATAVEHPKLAHHVSQPS